MTMPAFTLQVDADCSLLLGADGVGVTLHVSPHAIAARHWPEGRPGPLALEHAIDDVENAIEQAGLRHADRGVLAAADSLRQVMPQQFAASRAFSRDEVEAEFSRLVAASEPGSAGAGRLPGGEAAAALLLVREVMHHLGFEALR